MSRDTPPTYLLDRSFTDVDDLAVEAKQWSLDLRQLDRGRFSANILQFGLPDIHISEARFCRTLIQRGSPPKGMRTIAIPAVADLQLQWRNKLVDGQSLMIFPRGAELSSVSGPDFHVYTCSFSEDLLDGLDESKSSAEVVRVGSAAIARLRRGLHDACQQVRQDASVLSSDMFGAMLAHNLPRTLTAAIATGNENARRPRRTKRHLALDRAEAFIEQHASSAMKVEDICRASGVSERTLEYAFDERYGMGPKRFLNAYRLFSVRRDLRVADPDTTTVADIANRWGFWHMGQFAADYRQQFEELPSQTLASI